VQPGPQLASRAKLTLRHKAAVVSIRFSNDQLSFIAVLVLELLLCIAF